MKADSKTIITQSDIKLGVVDLYILLKHHVKWDKHGIPDHTWTVYIVSPERRALLGGFPDQGAAFRFARMESKQYDLPLLQES